MVIFNKLVHGCAVQRLRCSTGRSTPTIKVCLFYQFVTIKSRKLH